MKLSIILPAILATAVIGACSGTTPASPSSPWSSPDASGTATPTVAPAPSVTATVQAAPKPEPTAAPLCPAVDEATYDATQFVPATANIFGSGHDVPPAPGGGGRGTLPPVWPLAEGVTTVRITCAMGTVIPIRDSNIANGAGGDLVGRTDIASFEGISGVVHATNGMFLAGVFLTDAEPADPAPDRLDFTGAEGFATLSPLIGQVFFVGDGVGKQFVVPTGATRLYLGFADAAGYQGDPGWYGNNVGYLDVTVEISG